MSRPRIESTPFSFHCMICFEEFHPDDRYPVVLPCGHTYVCNCCANRLDRCMECRTPLYELVPHPKPPKTVNTNFTSSPSWSSARTGHRPSPTTVNRYGVNHDHDPPPQPPMKRRLALPKNVVLLSLIQATELASKDAAQKYSESPLPRNSGDSDEAVIIPNSNIQSMTDGVGRSAANIATGPSIPDLKSRGSMLDMDDEEEEEKIKISTSLAVGKAGTYAVAYKEGLQIFPSRPSSLHGENIVHEEDVESIVRVYHLDQANSSRDDDENHRQGLLTSSVTPTTPDPAASVTTPILEQSNQEQQRSSASPITLIPPPPPEPYQPTMSERLRNKKDPVKLLYGDRIQVVSIDNGWAKLARGYGFVRAEKNHIVKVGGAVDRACKIEAMLCSLSNRRKELRLEQSKIDNQFIRYINELQHSLQTDEDLTVILADTFAAPTGETTQTPMEDLSNVHKEEKADTTNDTSSIDYPQKPLARPQTPPQISSRASRFACFTGGVFGDSDDNNNDDSLNQLRFSFSNDLNLLRGSQDADPEASSLFPLTSHPSPSAMRAGAQAWRELNIGTPSSDSSINFRTGMSGHLALLSTHAHAHEYLEPQTWNQPHGSHHRGGGSGGGQGGPNSNRPSTSSHRMSSHTGLTMPRMPTLQGILNSLTLPLSTTTPPSTENRNHIPQSGSM